MEYLGGHNLFTKHFVIGCWINPNKSIDCLNSVSNFLQFVEEDWGMDKFKKRIQYLCYLEEIDLLYFKCIVEKFASNYKKNFPYSEKEDFLKQIFDYTIYELEEIISRDYTWIGQIPNETDFIFYYDYDYKSNEFLIYVVPEDKTIEYFQQYYKRVIKIIQEIKYEEEQAKTFIPIVNDEKINIQRLDSITNKLNELEQKDVLNIIQVDFIEFFRDAKLTKKEQINFIDNQIKGMYLSFPDTPRTDFFIERLKRLKEAIAQPQLITKPKPELTDKLITFNSNETIEKLHTELKGYFLNKEAELLKVLQGELLTELILFPHNQNRFVEVFKRLKYNGFILSTPTEIKDWICSNFTYVKTIGIKKSVENFNENSVWDVLTKAKCEPSKKNRICETDWLPFIKQDLRKKEAENEKL
ncbi:MAG: hypothetical protein KF732_12925 [Flavobacteriales bacterium]|nr:hypothetical protein [Flavobacteriales bacterium]